jgi:hypothetical protein
MNPLLRGADPGEDRVRGVTEPSVEEARARLNHNGQFRDLTAAGAPSLAPTNMTPTMAAAFATATHANAVLERVLGAEPLQDLGTEVLVPRASSGASAAVQSAENNAPSETDPVFSLVRSPVSLVTGTLKGSMQLMQRSTVNPDLGIASELGAALGAETDRQLLVGTGTAPNTLGLLSVSGVTTNAAAAATNPAVGLAIGKTYAEVAIAAGLPPDLALMHPRRDAHLAMGATDQGERPRLPSSLTSVEVPAMPVNLGAGTNEDRIILLRRDQVKLFVGPPTIRFVFDGSVSGTLSWRLVAHRYIAFAPHRKPTTIGVITGLTTPAWT